jgi:hypothetical protein
MDEQRPPLPEEPDDNAAGGQAMPAPPAPFSSMRPGTPVAGPPPMSRSMSAARQRAGTLATLGGLLVIAGVLLPWFTVSGPGGSQSQSGMSLGNWGVLLLGGFALARGLSILRPARFRMNLGTPLIGGVLLAFLIGSRWSDLQNGVRAAHDVGLQASVGIGYWAAVAGTALLLGGGLLSLRRQ